MTTAASSVFDTNDREFDQAVIERSRNTPVVVDFWAPWCGPCRVLGPVLERLAGEAEGAFLLAKVNADENPRLSQRFGVRGIPMVLAFREGKQVDSFTGALPESQVRTWLRKVIPSGADALASEAARLLATDPQKAADRYRAALDQDPAHQASLLGLGRTWVLLRDPKAEEVLKRVPAHSKAYGEAQSLLMLNAFLQTGKDSADRDGVDPRYAAAAELGRNGQWEAVLKQLLEIVQRDGVAQEGGVGDKARRAALAIFSLLGDTDPLVPPYRRLLANALF